MTWIWTDSGRYKVQQMYVWGQTACRDVMPWTVWIARLCCGLTLCMLWIEMPAFQTAWGGGGQPFKIAKSLPSEMTTSPWRILRHDWLTTWMIKLANFKECFIADLSPQTTIVPLSLCFRPSNRLLLNGCGLKTEGYCETVKCSTCSRTQRKDPIQDSSPHWLIHVKLWTHKNTQQSYVAHFYFLFVTFYHITVLCCQHAYSNILVITQPPRSHRRYFLFSSKSIPPHPTLLATSQMLLEALFTCKQRK